MKFSFTVKSLGKKRAWFDHVAIELSVLSESTTQDLLGKIVEQQVDAFNLRKEDTNLIDFLKEETLEENAVSGSVKFNEQYNRTNADKAKAIEMVLQAFEDGLIAFFLNDHQLEEINEPISLSDGDAITLIKLTFLAGRSW